MALDAVRRGDAEKLVVASELRCRAPGGLDLERVLASLRARDPACRIFAVVRGAATFLGVLLLESFVARVIALWDPRAALRRTAFVVRAAHALGYPVVRPLYLLVTRIGRNQGTGEDENEEDQDEEVEAFIEVGQREGILEASEGEMMRSIVDLDETVVATGFQNIVYDSRYFPKELRDEIYGHIAVKYKDERKSDETDEQFQYKTRKKSFGDFKKELWNLPDSNLGEIMKELEYRFSLVFHKLNVIDTVDLVNKYVTDHS